MRIQHFLLDIEVHTSEFDNFEQIAEISKCIYEVDQP